MTDRFELRMRCIEAAARTPASVNSDHETIAKRVKGVAAQWFDWVMRAEESATAKPVVSSEVRPSVADKPKRPA